VKPEVIVTVRRLVDGQILDYTQECSEAELDGVLATEENHPGKILTMEISLPDS
jgi:hypothetical protein